MLDLKSNLVRLEYKCEKCESIINSANVPARCPCGNTDLKLLAAFNPKSVEVIAPSAPTVPILEIYTRIIKVLKKYLDTEESTYKIIALWIIGTYLHENFDSYPYLFFNAMRGSGKTRVLKLISTLGAKGDGSVQNNLTEAVLFRVPRGTTTCIDEMEQIGKKEKQTLRELLNSAYKKGTSVKRMRKQNSKEGEKQVVEEFKPYFPIALANIWGIDEVLSDRSITLILEKSNNPYITKLIEDFDDNLEIQALKFALIQFSAVSVMSLRKIKYREVWNEYIYTNSTTTHTTQTTLTTLHQEVSLLNELFSKIDALGIFGRNLELFFPLIIVAQEIGVLDELLPLCSEICDKKKEEEYSESKDISLYDFVFSIRYEGLNYLAIKELTRRFREYMGEEELEDRWLNERWFGRAVKRLNLINDSRRMTQGKQVMLNYAKAAEKLKIFKKEVKDANS